jgi:hypothetical protein
MNYTTVDIDDEKMRERAEFWVLSQEPVQSSILDDIWINKLAADQLPALSDWEFQDDFLESAATVLGGGNATGEDDELIFLYQKIFAVKYKNNLIVDASIKALLDSATNNAIARNLI